MSSSFTATYNVTHKVSVGVIGGAVCRCSPPFVTRRVPLLSEAQVCGRILLEGFVTLTISGRAKPATISAESPRPFEYFVPPATQEYNPYGSTPHQLTPSLPGQHYSYAELFIFT